MPRLSPLRNGFCPLRAQSGSFEDLPSQGVWGSPSPMPEFRRTPQENHMADERVRASSSSSSLFTLNRPKGLQKSKPQRLAGFCPISSTIGREVPVRSRAGSGSFYCLKVWGLPNPQKWVLRPSNWEDNSKGWSRI